MPDHLLLTETDNPGALKWLKKNNEVGMPVAIKSVVESLALLRQSTREQIERLIHNNFTRLVEGDPSWQRSTELYPLAGLIGIEDLAPLDVGRPRVDHERLVPPRTRPMFWS